MARRLQSSGAMRSLHLAALSLATTAACFLPPDTDIIQWSDDFEACADLCAWTLDGDARRVTTYHPGEHALWLAPHARATHALAINRSAIDGSGPPPQNPDDGNWLELSTDCVGPGSLEVRADGVDRFVIEMTLDDRAIGRFTRHRVNLPPIDPTRAIVLSGLELIADTLPCHLDNLQLRITGGDYGY